MEKVISHFDKHGKVIHDRLITAGDLLEFKNQLLLTLNRYLKAGKSN
jgi:hypothetical protein